MGAWKGPEPLPSCGLGLLSCLARATETQECWAQRKESTTLVMITLPKAKPGGAAAFRGRGELMMKEMSDAENTEPAPAQSPAHRGSYPSCSEQAWCFTKKSALSFRRCYLQNERLNIPGRPDCLYAATFANNFFITRGNHPVRQQKKLLLVDLPCQCASVLEMQCLNAR